MRPLDAFASVIIGMILETKLRAILAMISVALLVARTPGGMRVALL